MATLVLGAGAVWGATAAGSALIGAGWVGLTATGTAIAFGIGATAGAFLDQMYVYPSILPGPPDIEGARLEIMPYNPAHEGSPIVYLAGPMNRVSGAVIYAAEISEHKDVESIDVGFCDEQKLTSYRYTGDIAIGLCKGEMDSITRIWANGNLIYKKMDEYEVTSNLFWIENSFEVAGFLAMVIKSPPEGPDLSRFQSGMIGGESPQGWLITSGFSNPENNSLLGYPVLDAGTWSGGTYVKVLNIVSAEESPGAMATLYQWQLSMDERTAASIKEWPGSHTQPVDPLLALVSIADGPCPAYRGTAYVMIYGLELEDFGNQYPVFTFEIKQAETRTVGSIIGELLERGGLSSSDYDVNTLTDEVKGYIVQGITPVARAILPLLRCFNITVREVNGVLEFIKRGNEIIIEIDSGHLAARVENEEAPRLLNITDVAGYTLPSEVNVNYMDQSLSLQKSSQRAKRADTPIPSIMNIDLPITMNASEARVIAERELWAAWTNRQTIQFTLPPRYLNLKEQDIVTVTAKDVAYRIVIIEINRGYNYLLSIKGLIESAEPLEYNITGEDPNVPVDDDIQLTPFLGLILIDVAPLTSAHIDSTGLYIAVTTIDPDALWPGAMLYVSSTGDIEGQYSPIYTIPIQSTAGISETYLGDGPYGYFDKAVTVTVRIQGGTLSGCTLEDLLHGANIAYLGGEIFGFLDVEPLGDNRYKLSTLLRGMRNTEDKISTHGIYENFALLTPTNLSFIRLETSWIGLSLNFKVVGSGVDIADLDPIVHSFYAGSCKTFQPALLRAVREPNDDVEVTWEYRAREMFRMFGNQPIPVPYGGEHYKIEFRDHLDVLKRTVEQDIRSYTYTIAQQTSDGIDPANDLSITVYHVHTNEASFGAGPGLEYILEGS